MLDLGFDVMYGNSRGTEEFKKECFLLNTPQECNEPDNNSDIFNDSIFDFNDFSNNHGNLQNDNQIFRNMDDSITEYPYFQHSISEDSSILSYPDPVSPDNIYSEMNIKNEMYSNFESFPHIEEFLENDPSSGYQTFSNAPPIMVQPMVSSSNSDMSSTIDNIYSFPFINSSSNIFHLSRDTIVYVPTPVCDLQSNLFFNDQVGQPFLNFSIPHSSILSTQAQISEDEPMNAARVAAAEKAFCCPTCDVKFTRRDELRRHEKIHSGEKPLSCPYCDKCFIRSDHRKTHIRTHTGEKPYECDICHKRFARSDEKLRHTKTHYRERPRKRRRKKMNDVTPSTESRKGNAIETKIITNVSWEAPLSNYSEENETRNYITSINSIFSSEPQYPSTMLEQLWNS